MNRYFPALVLLIALPFSAQAVDMPLTAVDGSQANLEQYEGKWVVVNYWATWCPPCIVEMPELQSFRHSSMTTLSVTRISSPSPGNNRNSD